MNIPTSIITLSHTTSPGSYVRMAMGEVLTRYRWSVVAPFALVALALLTISIYTADLRYILTLLMLMLIVAPGLLALVYFSAALTPTAAMSVLPRHLIIIPGKSITIIYEPFVRSGNIIKPHKPTKIKWENIKAWKDTGEHTLAISPTQTFIIPHSSLPCHPSQIFPIS